MTARPSCLGERAAMLLGLLDAPLTAAELYDKAEAALSLGADFLESVGDLAFELVGFRGSSPAVTLQAIERDGVHGVHLLLRRLEQHGYAGRLVTDDEIDNDLWWPTLPHG